jgi:DNA sulfur modification protein DndD
LKESIEAVLGIPVLRDAAATLRQIDEATTKDFKNHVKGNKKRKEISETVAKLQKRVEALRESIKAAKEAAAKAHSRIRELEHRLKDNEVAQRLIQEREHEEGRLKELRESAKGALESLQDAAEDGWKAVLHDVVDGQTATLNERAVEVSENLDRVRRDSFLAELRREAAKTGTCPCCGLDHQKSKQDKIDKSESETDRLAEELQGIRSQVSVLERLGSGFVQGALASAHKNNYEARNRLSLAESAIQELKEKLVGINEADVHEVAQEHANQTILLEKANSLKEENEKDLFEVREDIARLQKSFVEEGDDDLSDLQRKIDLVNGLAEFFDQASEAYREDQKARVEEEATKIFLSVAHQDQYERLQITETYGLQIIHEDGTIEKGRSSGYEHIVAVSLIGALQKTSPVKGPVVMDSPFGRLDIEHGNNVIALLPELAPQVLLLVTDRELDTKTVSKVLDPKQLIAERNLIQVSARHTQIETLGGGS